MGEAPVPARSITMVLPRALIAEINTRQRYAGPPPVSREFFLSAVVRRGFDRAGSWYGPLDAGTHDMLVAAARYPEPETFAAWLADNPDLTDSLVGDLLAGVWRADPIARDQLGDLLEPLTTHGYPLATYLAETMASPVPRHPRLSQGRRALEAMASPDELLHGSGVPDIEVLRATQPDGASRNVLGANVSFPDPLIFFTRNPELAGLIAVAKRSGGALTMCTHVFDDDTVGVCCGPPIARARAVGRSG